MSAPKTLPVRGDGYVTPPDRPEYVHCILTPYGEPEKKRHSICGYYVHLSFAFVSLDHAFCEAHNEGRLAICSDCARMAIETLQRDL